MLQMYGQLVQYTYMVPHSTGVKEMLNTFTTASSSHGILGQELENIS